MANSRFVFTASEHNLKDDFPLVVSHWIHDSQTYIPIHSHEFIEITFVVDGCATHVFHAPISGSFESVVSKGDIFIINPGEEHTFKVSEKEKVEVINLLFYSNIIDWTLLRDSEGMELMDFFYVQPFFSADIRFGNVLKLNQEEASFVKQLVGNIESEYNLKKVGYQLLIKLMMTQLIILLSRKFLQQKQDERYWKNNTLKIGNLQRVLGYLERHYAEDITVEQLSKICICSSRQLTRVFKNITGETIFNYLHKLRIEKAKMLLRNTENKILDISSTVGFNDISFFNRVFKKMTGESPKEYRNKHLQTGGIDHGFIGTLDLDK